MTPIAQEIREFVVKNFLFGQDNGLQDTDSFLESGIIDSTGVLELVSHLEGRYSIKIGDDELVPDNLDSVTAITRFVSLKQGQAA
jgi:acyl carrier protein